MFVQDGADIKQQLYNVYKFLTLSLLSVLVLYVFFSPISICLPFLFSQSKIMICFGPCILSRQHSHNKILLMAKFICLICFGDIRTDGHTDGPTDGQTKRFKESLIRD